MKNIIKTIYTIIEQIACSIIVQIACSIIVQIACSIIEQIVCSILKKIVCAYKYYKKKNHIQKKCDTVNLNTSLKNLHVATHRYISDGQRVRKDESLNQCYDNYTSRYNEVIDDYEKSKLFLDKKVCDKIDGYLAYLKEDVSKFKCLKNILESERSYYYNDQKLNDMESEQEELQKRIRKMIELKSIELQNIFRKIVRD